VNQRDTRDSRRQSARCGLREQAASNHSPTQTFYAEWHNDCGQIGWIYSPAVLERAAEKIERRLKITIEATWKFFYS
jgi:hypothetical protein